jgi:hypothetical protein
MLRLGIAVAPVGEHDVERRGLAAWRARDELRRSSAAQRHRNRKHYSRKDKHRNTYIGDREVRW